MNEMLKIQYQSWYQFTAGQTLNEFDRVNPHSMAFLTKITNHHHHKKHLIMTQIDKKQWGKLQSSRKYNR